MGDQCYCKRKTLCWKEHYYHVINFQKYLKANCKNWQPKSLNIWLGSVIRSGVIDTVSAYLFSNKSASEYLGLHCAQSIIVFDVRLEIIFLRDNVLQNRLNWKVSQYKILAAQRVPLSNISQHTRKASGDIEEPHPRRSMQNLHRCEYLAKASVAFNQTCRSTSQFWRCRPNRSAVKTLLCQHARSQTGKSWTCIPVLECVQQWPDPLSYSHRLPRYDIVRSTTLWRLGCHHYIPCRGPMKSSIIGRCYRQATKMAC